MKNGAEKFRTGNDYNIRLNQRNLFTIFRNYELFPRNNVCLLRKFTRIEERTLRIGFGIKRASKGEIGMLEFFALQPALNRCEPVPFGPLTTNQFFRLNHAGKPSTSH
jgi:hypothetical protein